MIGLLNRFLTSRLHYSIVSPSPSAVLSFPHSPEIPFSSAGVNSFSLFRSSYSSSHPVSAFPLPLTLLCPNQIPKTLLPKAEGRNIRLPNYRKQQRGDSFSPSHAASVALLRLSLSPFGIPLPVKTPTLIVNGSLRTTSISDTHLTLREVPSRHVTEHSQ